jgi:hypothetical protein
LSNVVYEAWLADRGVQSPGSQPFEVLETSVDPTSRFLLLSAGLTESKEVESTQLSKLAHALIGFDQVPVSWILLKETVLQVPVTTLRGLMPSLTRLVLLDDLGLTEGGSFRDDRILVASRPVEVFYGPSLATMNLNSELKSLFWQQLRAWNT